VFDRAAKRRGTPADLLVVGLGNPGAQYAGTRHNIGFEAVELLADRHGSEMRMARRERAMVADVRIGGRLVALANPQTFMNLSGESLALLVPRFGIVDVNNIVVVHDEIDLPVGALRVKRGGGAAGNNGIKSIDATLGTPDYARIRVGVGRPPSAQAGKAHVLKKPSAAERTELDVSVVLNFNRRNRD